MSRDKFKVNKWLKCCTKIEMELIEGISLEINFIFPRRSNKVILISNGSVHWLNGSEIMTHLVSFSSI